jgi:hypothetical protein
MASITRFHIGARLSETAVHNGTTVQAKMANAAYKIEIVVTAAQA